MFLYSAGGIVIQDIRMRDVISYFATYVFEKEQISQHCLVPIFWKDQKPEQLLQVFGQRIMYYH